jgi:hypothetical protein
MSNRGWKACESEEEAADYYRDTLGGRQFLTRREVGGGWDLTQEGYLGVMGTGDSTTIQTIADGLADVQHLRVANMDAFEFCKALYFTGARAVKAMVSGDTDRAEDGLKDVAQLEAYCAILRARLTDKTEHQSIASRAEEVSSNILRLVNNFYGELGYGLLEAAGDKLAGIREQANEMQDELQEELGNPKNKS